ncbi:mechanosensitive ion channel family protein [Sneathiella sp.]|uniref:mechanosensitive ion channel family protein n=1 Tax=Sneathiella sp. TaxID=1964365 RepID=UPI003566491E
MDKVSDNIETVSVWVNLLADFAVEYGFQILGAIVFLIFGLLVINWIGNRLSGIALARNVDVTLSQFAGSATKIILVILLIIITLGNFGVSIAPLIALAGAISFGATLALQGPISNFGAGIVIILTRPFVVGNVITVQGVSGVVDRITLGITFLTGEDHEQIAVPNREIVGQVIVNSREMRIVESKFCVSAAVDIAPTIRVVEEAVARVDGLSKEHQVQIGIQDFTYGGIIIGVRVWVPGLEYFQSRYAINGAVFEALKANDIKLMEIAGAGLMLPSLEAADSTGISPPLR